jgi:hypothetical protein
LHAVGYRLVRIEQPLGTAEGEVSVDVLLLAEARNALLAVECKGGTVQERQANACEAMTALDVVQTANITVPEASLAALDVAYAIPPSLTNLQRAYNADVSYFGARRLRPPLKPPSRQVGGADPRDWSDASSVPSHACMKSTTAEDLITGVALC